MSENWRGASSVISVILMVAVVVILSATASVAFLDISENINEPAPQIAQSTGEFITNKEGTGSSGGIVKIKHIAGDSVAITDIEIVVRAECDDGTKQGRIVNLPAGDGNAIRESDGQIKGDNIFDGSSLNTIAGNVDGVSDGGALLNDEEYTAGDSIIFRIDQECVIKTGNRVSVQIVHIPSEAIIIDKNLTP